MNQELNDEKELQECSYICTILRDFLYLGQYFQPFFNIFRRGFSVCGIPNQLIVRVLMNSSLRLSVAEKEFLALIKSRFNVLGK